MRELIDSRRRMKVLFKGAEIFAVIEYQKQELKKAFQSVTNAELDADPVAVAARRVTYLIFARL